MNIPEITLPQLTLVRQRFPRPLIDDVDGTLRAQLDGCGVTVQPGQRIALAVGSRGIADLTRLVTGVIDWVVETQVMTMVAGFMPTEAAAASEALVNCRAGSRAWAVASSRVAKLLLPFSSINGVGNLVKE